MDEEVITGLEILIVSSFFKLLLLSTASKMSFIRFYKKRLTCYHSFPPESQSDWASSSQRGHVLLNHWGKCSTKINVSQIIPTRVCDPPGCPPSLSALLNVFNKPPQPNSSLASVWSRMKTFPFAEKSASPQEVFLFQMSGSWGAQWRCGLSWHVSGL